MMLFTFVALISLMRGTWCGGGAHYSYAHQDKWPELCQKGTKQSPVNLPDPCGNGVTADEKLTIKLTGYDKNLPLDKEKFVNNGHTVQLNVEGFNKKNGDAPTVSGSVAKGAKYQFVQLHFHWPYNSSQGSEDEVAGKRLTIENHLVHFNTKYATIGEAANQTDGLLVLGILYRLNDKTYNNPLTPLIGRLPKIDQNSQMTEPGKAFNLKSLLPANFDTKYYTYSGSLTTPPCYESVTWVVFQEVQPIGKKQLMNFQNITDKVNRYRPVQPLNGRKVYVPSKKSCGMK